MITALLGAALVAATVGAAPAAGARAALAVDVTGSCPTAEALTAALASALGEQGMPATAAPPRVADQGGAFEVAVLGQRQRYSDSARDCAERARVAAVFIALTLNPPDLPVPAPAPPPAPATIVAAAPTRAETAPATWAELGAAGRIDGGGTPGEGSVGYVAGGEVRGAVGRRAWGVAGTIGILAPTESVVSSVTVRQQRFPVSLSVLARHALSTRVALAGAAGVALVPFTLRGEGLATSQPATRLDTGVRLAGSLELRMAPRFVGFFELHAEYFPRAYELNVDPTGGIGSTSRLWVGASVGAAFDLHAVSPAKNGAVP